MKSVEVKINGASDVNFTAAGGTIAKNVPPESKIGAGEGANLKIEASDLNGGTYEFAGEDVLHFVDQVTKPLDELTHLLAQNLSQKEQIQDLQEIVAQLKKQVAKPKSSRDFSKIQGLLNSVGNYLELASLAATQTENAKKLLEVIKGLAGI